MPRHKKGTTDHDGDGKMGGSAKVPVVLVGGVISDGAGGYLPKGAKLDAAADIESLTAKGLVG